MHHLLKKIIGFTKLNLINVPSSILEKGVKQISTGI